MKTIIIGAGSDLGVHIDGANLGSTQLLNDLKTFYQGETINILRNQDIIKNRNLSNRLKNEYEIDEYNSKLYNTILEKTKEEIFPIVIGGDHSVSIPSTLASSKKYENVGMIYFGAHADFNTLKSTVSGNIHGLTNSTITGYENKELRYYSDANPIPANKAVLIGIRNIDEWEKDNLKYSGIKVFTDQDIKNIGLTEVLNQAFEIANHRTNGIHICIDLDILNPVVAPGVSVPAINGLTETELMEINKYLITNIKKILAYDLVEFNPLRDLERKTEQIALNLLAQIILNVEKNK